MKRFALLFTTLAMLAGVSPAYGNSSVESIESTTAPAGADMLAPAADPFDYEPLSPARLLDTRPNTATIDGQMAGGGALGAASTLSLPVLGRGGVPTINVAAVVLNVTVTSPSTTSYLSVFPAGESPPNASNLNYIAGQTVPNLVIVKLGTGGHVGLFNEAGTVHVLADVVGWFPTGAALRTMSPSRLLDTRPGTLTVDGQFAGSGALGAGATRPLTVTGRAGLPSTGVGAVILNVTATAPSTTSYVTVWPAGQSRPNASNLNFTAGVTTPNLVTVKVGSDGQVNFFNESGTVHLIADIVGWFGPDEGLRALNPARLLDTRPGGVTADGAAQGTGALAPGGGINLRIAGRGGVPAGAGSVVLNVTATSPTSGGYLVVYPRGESLPNASNLNFVPGLTVPNLVISKVSIDGWVSIANSAGNTHVLVDVVGWFPRTPALSVGSTVLPPAIAGTPYSYALPAFGSRGPYTWSGSAAPGLSLASTGLMSGTPTEARTFSVPVTVRDDFNRTDTDEVSHTVFPAGSGYMPVTPAVVLNQLSTPLASNSTVGFAVAGVNGVPAGATGVLLEVTAGFLDPGGYLTLFPAGSVMPIAAQLSAPVGSAVTSNRVFVPVGAGGSVNLFSSLRALVLIEVLGYIGTGAALTPTIPFRIHEGRVSPATSTVTASTPAPPGATHVLAQVLYTATTTPTRFWGLAAPTGSLPALSSTQLLLPNEASLILVPIGPGGTVTFQSSSAVTSIIDVYGYVVPPPP